MNTFQIQGTLVKVELLPTESNFDRIRFSVRAQDGRGADAKGSYLAATCFADHFGGIEGAEYAAPGATVSIGGYHSWAKGAAWLNAQTVTLGPAASKANGLAAAIAAAV